MWDAWVCARWRSAWCVKDVGRRCASLHRYHSPNARSSPLLASHRRELSSSPAFGAKSPVPTLVPHRHLLVPHRHLLSPLPTPPTTPPSACFLPQRPLPQRQLSPSASISPHPPTAPFFSSSFLSSLRGYCAWGDGRRAWDAWPVCMGLKGSASLSPLSALSSPGYYPPRQWFSDASNSPPYATNGSPLRQQGFRPQLPPPSAPGCLPFSPSLSSATV